MEHIGRCSSTGGLAPDDRPQPGCQRATSDTSKDDRKRCTGRARSASGSKDGYCASAKAPLDQLQFWSEDSLVSASSGAPSCLPAANRRTLDSVPTFDSLTDLPILALGEPLTGNTCKERLAEFLWESEEEDDDDDDQIPISRRASDSFPITENNTARRFSSEQPVVSMQARRVQHAASASCPGRITEHAMHLWAMLYCVRAPMILTGLERTTTVAELAKKVGEMNGLDPANLIIQAAGKSLDNGAMLGQTTLKSGDMVSVKLCPEAAMEHIMSSLGPLAEDA